MRRDQETTLHQVADRHRDPHSRAFATTHKAAVPEEVVISAVRLLGFAGVEPGSYCITIGWPYDVETGQDQP